MGLKLTIERSYQTHSNNIHLKNDRIIQKVLKKEKHVLKQDTQVTPDHAKEKISEELQEQKLFVSSVINLLNVLQTLTQTDP